MDKPIARRLTKSDGLGTQNLKPSIKVLAITVSNTHANFNRSLSNKPKSLVKMSIYGRDDDPQLKELGCLRHGVST